MQFSNHLTRQDNHIQGDRRCSACLGVVVNDEEKVVGLQRRGDDVEEGLDVGDCRAVGVSREGSYYVG